MSNSIHVVCPACLAINRLPTERLGQGPKCGQCSNALFGGKPLALTGANFRRHLERNGIPVVIDFWAPWCGPCKTMAPEFEHAAQELEPDIRLAKVDTEAEPALASEFNIRGIPTLIFFQNGRERARRSGAIRAHDIVAWVRQTAG